MPKDPNVILDHYIEVSKSRDIMDPEELQKIIDAVLNVRRTDSTLARYLKWYGNKGRKFLSYAKSIDVYVKDIIEGQPWSKSHKNWAMAAYQVGAATEARSYLKEGHIERAAELVRAILESEPDYDRSHWRHRTHEKQGFTDAGRKENRKRKRRIHVSPDAREHIVDGLRDEFHLLGMAQAVAGCRTQELVNCVVFYVYDDHICVSVAGAKTNQGHGQVWREFEIDPFSSENPLAMRLFDWLTENRHTADNPFSAMLPEYRKKAYEHHFSRVARKVLGINATPICLRHQMASDLKSDGFTGEEIAQIMGHCSDLTAAKHYGLVHRGVSTGIVGCRASQEVNLHKTRNPMDLDDNSPSP